MTTVCRGTCHLRPGVIRHPKYATHKWCAVCAVGFPIVDIGNRCPCCKSLTRTKVKKGPYRRKAVTEKARRI